jgi:HAMP domain-containing protein
MARALVAVALVSVAACTRVVERPVERVVERRADAAEIERLEREIVIANADRAELRRRVEELERSVRASRARTGGGAPPSRPAAPGACSGWLDVVDDHPWDVSVACRILWCESRGDPNARNGRHVGLFQIADGPADPAANVALAASMWSRRGWQPWDASRRCWRT